MRIFALAFLFVSLPAFATDLAVGEKAIHSMTGCYLVDFSYTETESLKEGYQRDKRVYDVNTDKSIKEWIYAIDMGPGKIRLQHVMFGTDLEGNLQKGSELRHTGEDWEFNAPFQYEFTKPLHWEVKSLSADSGLWTRRITNLDDGLRYQCSGAWSEKNAYAEWTCDHNYAPIPGRETRDMGRRDYQALDRSTRVVAYGNSWLERQSNTKIIHGADDIKIPLARELGKNWYVRLPDSECAPAHAFIAPRRPFWDLLSATWAGVLTGDRPFIEKEGAARIRYGLIMGLEEEYTDLTSPSKREEARKAILDLINESRAN